MKTNAQRSSIECFNGRVQSIKGGQHQLILSVMAAGADYTGQELAQLTGFTPNVISARLFELRDLGEVARGEHRRMCPCSAVLVSVHKRITNPWEDLI
jgi:DNA-binding HxlR family transcriptional regulator